MDAWILAGALDGAPLELPLETRIAGMPMLLRHACEAVAAGASRVVLVWFGDDEPPMDAIEAMARDDRLGGVPIEVTRSVPNVPNAKRLDASGHLPDVLLIRADRVYHRDHPKRVADARPGVLRAVEGDDSGAVFAGPTHQIAALAETASRKGQMSEAIAAGHMVRVEAPYLSFSVAASDRAGRRQAEKLLVRSLRKSADGYAARLINRHISLWLSRHLAKTPILPNHVTVLCFLSALAGGIILSRGGYVNGIIGMLFIELGSILDGIDGELARLKCRFSRVGQWMDTVTDDLSNVFLAVGTAMNLSAAGVEWAIPLAVAGLVAFAITQSSQYYFIATRYDSGDLAAIPWAFQSTEFLSSRPAGLLPRLKAGIPRLLKRDFFVTLFVALAIAGFLEGVLLLFAIGSIAFLFSYTLQYLRVRHTLRASID